MVQAHFSLLARPAAFAVHSVHDGVHIHPITSIIVRPPLALTLRLPLPLHAGLVSPTLQVGLPCGRCPELDEGGAERAAELAGGVVGGERVLHLG